MREKKKSYVKLRRRYLFKDDHFDLINAIYEFSTAVTLVQYFTCRASYRFIPQNPLQSYTPLSKSGVHFNKK